MKKRIICVLAGMLLLVGCANQLEEETKPKNSANAEKQEETQKKPVAKNEESKPHYFDKYFKEGEQSGELMAPYMDPDKQLLINAIQVKMQAGIKENQEWYAETLDGLGEGEQFPYDKRLGISKDEYEQILSVSDHTKLKKVQEYSIDMKKDGDILNISIDKSPVIREIAISNDGKTIQTDQGEFKQIDEIKASDDQKVTGRWNGYVYQNDKSQEIDLGQLEESKQIIIRSLLSSTNQEIIYLDPPESK